MSEQNNNAAAPRAEASAGTPPDETGPIPSEIALPDSAAPESPARAAALEAELAEAKDRWLRAEAEMQNLRARARREAEDARNYAIQKFARDVVEAADNLRRGLDALPPAQGDEPPLLAKLRGGFEEVERSFLAILERNGVTRVDAQGAAFDPDLHQAMAEQPAPAGVAPGTVLQAWTPAWTLNGRLLKPAMVVVAGQPAAAAAGRAAGGG